MIVENKTHYFSEYSKSYNSVIDSDSFQFESSKRMGYFQRLWFEYAYTRKVNGMCFYYTLTYNDKSIPKFRGRNCFSYADIRYITNGKLSKVLLRSYGSRLRYFCACETGEGKGKRGLGNNPHLHFIFFVQPVHDSDGNPVFDNYVRITPNHFKDLIYYLWQGAPSDVFVHWQYAKFGHCQEGLFNGEVLSCEAFKYVGKYCVKDMSERYYEKSLEVDYTKELLSYDITFDVLYQYYKYLRLIDTEVKSKYDFINYMGLTRFNEYRKSHKFVTYRQFCQRNGIRFTYILELLDQWFKNWYIPKSVSEYLSEYRNNWSGKPRLSKSLGEYGLNFIMYLNGSPRVVLNTKKGYESQYPCLFYIRKLFYDVKICPYTGNPLYYLNERGIQMKMNMLPSSIDKFFSNTLENISYKQLNNTVVSLYDSYNEIGNILDCQLSHKKYVPIDNSDSIFNELLSHPDYIDIVYRYSVYHCVYQYRAFDKYTYLTEKCEQKDFLLDYSLFLHQSSFYLDYDEGTIFQMFHKSMIPCLSFSSHPAFAPYIKYFQYLDKLNEVVSRIKSDFRKVEFSERSKHQAKLKMYQFNACI